MAHSILTPGALIFAAVLTATVGTAGIASLPPERNTRVLIGAVIVLGNWVAALATVFVAGTHAATSLLVGVDALCAVFFYLIARPVLGEPPKAVFGRNWASYVVAVFAALIFLELAHLVVHYAGWHQAPLSLVLAGLVAVIAFGFWRGFGWRAFAVFALVVVLLAAAAVVIYVRVANIFTFMTIVIVAHAALGSAWRNIQSWRGMDTDPQSRSGSDRVELSVAPTAARNRP